MSNPFQQNSQGSNNSNSNGATGNFQQHFSNAAQGTNFMKLK